jgi:hypothetical protein
LIIQPDRRGDPQAPAVPILNLSHNRIYRGVPPSLRESKVVTLDISYNQLCGEIDTHRWADGAVHGGGVRGYEHKQLLLWNAE